MDAFSRSRRVLRTVAGLAAILALACGGETEESTGTGQGAGSCVQLDGTRQDDGTRIECACEGTTGTTTCENGEWSVCSCYAATGGSGGTGGSSGGGGPAPPVCGNGVLDDGEVCDGANLGGETCSSATMHALAMGSLRCTLTCTLDTSGCRTAGTGGIGGEGGMGFGGTGFGGTMSPSGGSPGVDAAQAGAPTVDASSDATRD